MNKDSLKAAIEARGDGLKVTAIKETTHGKFTRLELTVTDGNGKNVPWETIDVGPHGGPVLPGLKSYLNAEWAAIHGDLFKADQKAARKAEKVALAPKVVVVEAKPAKKAA